MQTRELTFTTTEVCRLAGITYRQLDYWARTGLLEPSIREAEGSGSSRRYSSQDVIDARILGRLTELGFRHQTLADQARVGSPAALIVWLIEELEALKAVDDPLLVTTTA